VNGKYVHVAGGLFEVGRPVLNIVPDEIAFVGQIFLDDLLNIISFSCSPERGQLFPAIGVLGCHHKLIRFRFAFPELWTVRAIAKKHTITAIRPA